MTISEEMVGVDTGEGQIMRTRILSPWAQTKADLMERFGLTSEEADKYEHIPKEDLIQAYAMMSLSRQFETACNQQYMQGNIRGFMHLDNGQETVPALVSDSIKMVSALSVFLGSVAVLCFRGGHAAELVIGRVCLRAQGHAQRMVNGLVQRRASGDDS